ncbi:hypothetical protein BH10PSE18_BH10PSE18_33630 [soil metagenome]
MSPRDSRLPAPLTRAEKKALSTPPMPEWTREHHHHASRKMAARKLLAERMSLGLLAVICFGVVAFLIYWFQPEIRNLFRAWL